MGKYLKLFETHAVYAAYIGGSNKVLPNVSYCENENEVHYNPWTETRVVATFNVTSTSEAINIMDSSATSQFSKIEIDGVVQPSVVSSYTFDTTGEHTVKYTLADPTEIGQFAFDGCTGLTSVTIPNSVTSIANAAFSSTSLTSVTIPNSVTSIANAAFSSNSVTSIVVDSGNTTYDSRDNCNAVIETATNKLIAGCQNTIIPNSVTSIGDSAFVNCTGLTSITIPSSVTSIGQDVFSDCSSLTSITSLATTAPTIDSFTFEALNTEGTLYVPSGSSGYDTWMETYAYFLGYFNWTKVEQ